MPPLAHYLRRFALGAGAGVAVYGGYSMMSMSGSNGSSNSIHDTNKSWPVVRSRDREVVLPSWTPPKRETVLANLEKEEFDVLVIGGGATGCGVALDCAKRGLSVALVERDDFASGTSSRSTKLIHGGIRYLAQAFQKKVPPRSLWDVFANLRFEKKYLDIVQKDLKERSFMIDSAPYMTRPIPMMIPIFRWWEVPMMFFVGKMYDAIAGRRLTVPPSHLINRSEALYQFPMLKQESSDGDKLRGALVLYDGQQNDTRMNLHIALTAAQNGAVVANHAALESLSMGGDNAEGVCGAVIKDTISGKKINVRCKQVINCTGVFADSIRKMVRPSVENIMVAGPGSHLVFPDYCSPASMGLVFFTRDGRVLYLLPWERSTLAGTTDSPGMPTFEPKATDKDVDFILSEVNRVLSTPVDRSTVRAAWCGLRPLVRDPNAPPGDTKALSRNHVVDVLSPSFLSIVGGKWTTYREMSEEAVDEAIKVNPKLFQYKHRKCTTAHGVLIGGDRGGLVCHRNFNENVVRLREVYGFDRDTARHLNHNYGTRSLQLAEMAIESDAKNEWKRLSTQYPMLEAEVIFAARCEYAETAVDVLARRTRLAFLDVKAALECLPRVLDIMQQEKGWSSARKRQEKADALRFLETMYLPDDDKNGGKTLEERIMY